MAIDLPSREQLEAQYLNSDQGTSGGGPFFKQMEDYTKIFSVLDVEEGAVQEFSTTPTKLNIFLDTPESNYLLEGGGDAGYADSIRMPCDCYCLVAVSLSFSHAAGAVRQFYYDIYKNGTLVTKGGGPAAASATEVTAPIISIDRFSKGDILEIYGYTNTGTFDVTFTAGHFVVLRVR